MIYKIKTMRRDGCEVMLTVCDVILGQRPTVSPMSCGCLGWLTQEIYPNEVRAF